MQINIDRSNERWIAAAKGRLSKSDIKEGERGERVRERERSRGADNYSNADRRNKQQKSKQQSATKAPSAVGQKSSK